jgi:protease I
VTTVAFLVAHEGIEQIELTSPWQAVQEAGAAPVLVSYTTDPVQGFNHLDKADTFEVDRQINEMDLDAFDVLVLPGGVANPDALRQDEWAVKLVTDALAAGKPVAAICLRNAGATWVDEELVVDTEGPGPLITSRNPDDLEAFNAAIVDHLGLE